MKKLLLVVFCVSLLLTTGCGKSENGKTSKNQLVCSKSETSEEGTMSVDVVMDLDKDDKVTNASMVYDFGDEETAKVYCDLFKLSTDESKISCSGSKITIKDIDDMEDETEDSEDFVGKTKAEVKQAAEEEGFTCK